MNDIYLITGFLGSGKTTLLKKLLDHSQAKIGVLINEFGKINIDGQRINNNNIDTIELSNGSIFCACLKERFIEGLIELINKKPDYIFIESSGLSDPSNINHIIPTLKKLTDTTFEYKGNICVVDALYFIRIYEKMVNVQRQVKYSDLLLINKVDLVDANALVKIKKFIKEKNKVVKIIETTYSDLNIEDLKVVNRSNDYDESTNTKDNRIYSVTLHFESDVDSKSIKSIVDRLSPYCYRIKGSFSNGDEHYKVDSVLETTEVIEANEESYNDLVFLSSIGLNLLSKIHESCNEFLENVDFEIQA